MNDGAGDAGVPAHDHLGAGMLFFYQGAKSGSRFNNVDRCEVVPSFASNGASKAGNGFD